MVLSGNKLLLIISKITTLLIKIAIMPSHPSRILIRIITIEVMQGTVTEYSNNNNNNKWKGILDLIMEETLIFNKILMEIAMEYTVNLSNKTLRKCFWLQGLIHPRNRYAGYEYIY